MPKTTWLLHFCSNKTMVNFRKVATQLTTDNRHVCHCNIVEILPHLITVRLVLTEQSFVELPHWQNFFVVLLKFS